VQNLLWEGAVQTQKMQYEADLNIASALYGGQVQAANIMTQAYSQYGATMLSSQAQLSGAENQLLASKYGAQSNYSQNKTQIRSDLMTGLYGSIGSFSQNYFLQSALKSNSTGANQLATSYSGPVAYTSQGQAYQWSPSITTPGTSLTGASYK
jgi:hypothetical protein